MVGFLRLWYICSINCIFLPLLQCRICRNKPGCTSGPKYRVKLGEDPEPQRCSFIYHLAHHHGKLVDGESNIFPLMIIYSVVDPDPYALGHSDPHLDPLVTSTDPDPDPSIIKQKK